MKKALITFCLVLGSLMTLWAMSPAKVRNMDSLVREYRNRDGFEVVSMGNLGISLLKGAAVLSGELDAEDRAALRAFNGIKKLVIVNYEDASAKLKEEFNRQAELAFSQMDLIMEAKDDGEAMSIYGKDDGQSIRDCVLYSSDGTLILVKGSISLEHVGELMEMAE